MGVWKWIPAFSTGGGGGPSGFHSSSTTDQVTRGIDAGHLTAIVTGATSGIGEETARVLALRGANVVIPCRTPDTGRKVKASILQQNPNARIDVMEMDLSSLHSIESFVRSFDSSHKHLNILINNAAIFACPFQLSRDGIELQFATNHLGRYECFAAYSHSKLANIWHANELSRRLQEEGSNVTANSLHPGVISTNLPRYVNLKPFILAAIATMMKPFIKTIQQGAATTCYVALHPDVKDVTGKYFIDCSEALPSSTAQDGDLSSRFWDFSQDLVYKLKRPA